jgi:hypothetical protein
MHDDVFRVIQQEKTGHGFGLSQLTCLGERHLSGFEVFPVQGLNEKIADDLLRETD